MFGWFRKKKKAKLDKKKQNDVVVDDKKGLTVAAETVNEVLQTAPLMEEPNVKTSTPQKEDPEELPPMDLSKELPTEEPKEEKPKQERSLPYHITKHPKGGWQIKRGKAERALKRFDTQKEAIEYAKDLEKERGISYIIHKADGSIRKKDY